MLCEGLLPLVLLQLAMLSLWLVAWLKYKSGLTTSHSQLSQTLCVNCRNVYKLFYWAICIGSRHLCTYLLQSDWLYTATFQQYPVGVVYDRLLVSRPCASCINCFIVYSNGTCVGPDLGQQWLDSYVHVAHQCCIQLWPAPMLVLIFMPCTCDEDKQWPTHSTHSFCKHNCRNVNCLLGHLSSRYIWMSV